MSPKNWISETVDWAAPKLATVWGLFAISNWEEAASAAQFFAGLAGFIYSCILIFEWARKRRKKSQGIGA